jgi:hypothetical protein
LSELYKNGDTIELIDINPTQGMYIDLNSGTIWSKEFKLHAWNSDQGVYLSSTPDIKQPSYFRIGNSDSYIRFYQIYDKDSKKHTGDKFVIKSSEFKLEAGKRNSEDYIGLFSSNDDVGEEIEIAGTSSANWRIVAGDKFAVSKKGNVFAANIKATGGEIGGCKITDGVLTIKTANIADAAVTNAKIKSLDAEKITTGTIDAKRIGAKSITADKLDVNFATIDNLNSITIDAS